MAKLLQNPQISYIGGKYPWRLMTPLVYQSDIIGLIHVPAGFETDLASVPRLPFTHAIVGGKAAVPAIIHDLLYERKPCTRKEADGVFYEAMDVVNDPRSKIKRWLMYMGVRVGGWVSWNS